MPARALDPTRNRAWLLVLVSALVCALISTAAPLAAPLVVHAAAGTLYAATGAVRNFCSVTEAPAPSRLYTIDPATDSASLIGTITVDGTAVLHVTSLAISPTTGAMYAIANTQDWGACEDWGTGTLLLVDPSDASAEVIGEWGSLTLGNFPDASFDPWGNLFAWRETDDRLVSVDITDGTTTAVTPSGCETLGTGLAIDSGGFRWLMNNSTLYRLHHATGACDQWEPLGDWFLNNLASFDAADTLWLGARDSGQFHLYSFDVVEEVGQLEATLDIPGISAIEWDRTGLAAGTVADLSVDVTASRTGALLGDAVDFTVAVHNAGPDAATGVGLHLQIPSNYEIEGIVASQGTLDDPVDPDEWVVGSLGNGGHATLVVSMRAATAGFGDTLSAEVRSVDQLDPDSATWGDFLLPEDDADTVTVPVTDPDFDMAITDLQIKGNVRFSSKGVGVNVVVSNLGADPFSFNSDSHLRLTWNDQSSRVTCRLVTGAIAPGDSVIVRCKVNLNGSGVSPGATIVFRADMPFYGDADPANNVREVTVTAR